MENKKILIIEDDENIRRSLKLFLEDSGYEIDVASDGQEGEKKILIANPDLIVLDLNLPGRRGEEILKFIKNHGPTKDIPVIILTGKGNVATRLSCMIKGAADFINKPYENVKLLTSVKKLLV